MTGNPLFKKGSVFSFSEQGPKLNNALSVLEVARDNATHNASLRQGTSQGALDTQVAQDCHNAIERLKSATEMPQDGHRNAIEMPVSVSLNFMKQAGWFEDTLKEVVHGRQPTEEEDEALREELGPHYVTIKPNLYLPSKFNPNKIVADTVGHVGTAMMTPILQERTINALQKPNIRDYAKILRRFADKYPEEMGGLQVQMGAARPIETIRRAAGNEDAGFLERAVATIFGGPAALTAGLTRSHHYMPGSDSLTVYGNQPSILAHELGHGVDYRRKSVGQRDAYVGSSLLSRRFIPGNPMTPVIELNANRRARGAMEGDEKEDVKTRQQFRRIAYPAYGTYLSGTALALAAYQAHKTNRHNVLTSAYKKLHDKVYNLNIPDRAKPIALAAAGIIPAGILGRVLAETANVGDSLISHRARLKKEREEGDEEGE